MNYKILVVDDDIFQGKAIQVAIEKIMGFEVTCINSGKEAVEYLLSSEGDKVNLVILDLSMPDIDGLEVLDRICPQRPELPIIINTAYGDLKKAVLAVKKGAVDFIEKKDGPERLQLSIENVRLMTGLKKEVKKLSNFNNSRYSFEDIIGSSVSLQRTINAARKAAQSNIPILIKGESGVGKELFARAIHSSSQRADKPFIAVNCAAIPFNLAESVLFGHEKGSFTGAVERSLGKFREAGGGTIFLDEISELPLETQTKLLRAVQEMEIEPVGLARGIPVDVRIISASNKNLEDNVAKGTFREDLYYRLNVLQLDIPPLRQRKEDIPALLEHFIEKICFKEKRKIIQIAPELENILKEYNWPGNIRQLENAIYRAVVLSTNNSLTMHDFENVLAAITNSRNDMNMPERFMAPDSVGYANKNQAKFKTIAEHEKDIIQKALDFYNYNISKVSKILDVGRSTLYRKMKEYNIDMQGSVEDIEAFKQAREAS